MKKGQNVKAKNGRISTEECCHYKTNNFQKLLILLVLSFVMCFMLISTAYAIDVTSSYYTSLNPFHTSGYGLPNCTCFAWGRAYEALGFRPKTSTGNGNSFWSYNINNSVYPCGTEPKPGSIACWNGGSGGHVAYVESVSGNNVTISQSAWGWRGTDKIWEYKTISKYDMASIQSGFQGYIYLVNPANDHTSPTITSAAITQSSTNGYTVTCNASDNLYVAKLRIGTWNDIIGIDNAKWQNASVVNSNGSYQFYIDLSEFGNQRETVYHTNVYAYDGNGNISSAFRAADILIETEKPVVTVARIENLTPTSYEVVCKATDNGTVHRLRIGSWHDNMSIDDAVWQESEPFTSEVRFYVNASYFGGVQNVTYHTNVYAIDLCGNVSAAVRAGDPFLETTPPVVVNCEAVNISETGYDVIVTATDNASLSKLQIGTWHSGIPVDDAQWKEIVVDGQNSYTYTFHIDITDFGNAKDVTYYTNAYAFDACRNVSTALRTEPVILKEVFPDFILPAGTTTVEDYAFQGCAFTYVRLSDETTTLGNGAFADCPNLRHVYIPVRTVIIGSDVFPDNVTIHGKAGSYAETYANRLELKFVAE